MTGPDVDPVLEVREQLCERAHVFEHPDSYVAGVDAAIERVRQLDRDEAP
jgi:hypothetical protein